MILDGAQLSELLPITGATQARNEIDDSQVRIPNIFQPVFRTHRRNIVALDNALQNTSFSRSLTQLRTNQAAITQTVANFGRGLFTLQIWLSSFFNYVNPAAATDGIDVLVGINGTAVEAISRFASIGSWTDYIELDVLTTSAGNIQLRNGITGVGETNIARVNCWVIKRL